MKSYHFQPVTLLKPFIKTFMIVESGDGLQNNVLPDTTMTMAFRLRGAITHDANSNAIFPSSFVSGIRRSSLTVTYARDTLNVLVIFHEGAASAFFNTPLHEFAGIPLALNNLVQASMVRDVEEQLYECATHAERITLIENWLIARLSNYTPDQLVQHAIQKIKSAAGDIRIKQLVADLPISRDPFEKKFRKLVGTSPKQFAAIVRMRNLIDNYSATSTLTDVAYSAGYFDQSHFIKDFHSFTGKTPKEYFATPPQTW